MSCLFPLRAFRGEVNRVTGKRSVVFYPPRSLLHGLNGRSLDDYVTVPCGQCIQCRLSRARDWAVRCVHEQQMMGDSCFLTLTYSPEYVPSSGSLRPVDMTLFLKRLRKHYTGRRIRYFQVGEYGSQLSRPHHHVVLFGVDFAEQRERLRSGDGYFVSSVLADLWPFGYHVISPATYESIFYATRYCLKKVTGFMAEGHYGRVLPEYITMSRRPGLGRDFYTKYKADLYPGDQARLAENRVFRVPKYYDKLLEIDDFDLLSELKRVRLERFQRFGEFDLKESYRVKALLEYKTRSSSRKFENGGVSC